jgi:hypothetical protein
MSDSMEAIGSRLARTVAIRDVTAESVMDPDLESEDWDLMNEEEVFNLRVRVCVCGLTTGQDPKKDVKATPSTTPSGKEDDYDDEDEPPGEPRAVVCVCVFFVDLGEIMGCVLVRSGRRGGRRRCVAGVRACALEKTRLD